MPAVAYLILMFWIARNAQKTRENMLWLLATARPLSLDDSDIPQSVEWELLPPEKPRQ